MYDDYYPLGGWQDLVGEFSTWEEALNNVPVFSDFDLVEVNWEEKVFTEIDVYNLSPYREFWQERKERAEAERAAYTKAALEAQAERVKVERAKKNIENEMGPEATNAFVAFFSDPPPFS